MDPERLAALLEEVRQGSTPVDVAMETLRDLPYGTQLPFALLDHHRALRTGDPEVIYCPGKTPEQIVAIFEQLVARHDRVLATRCEPDVARQVLEALPALAHHSLPRLLTWGYPPAQAPVGRVAVLAAGTADLPVAEEAAISLEMAGVEVVRVWDVGVAGLHRLLAHRELLGQVDVVIAVAGMEGALPSVVAGLTDRPVVGVPTSVGYGTAFGGVTALLAMLNSCASGLAVVNIDNGFGAAHLAARIARQKVAASAR